MAEERGQRIYGEATDERSLGCKHANPAATQVALPTLVWNVGQCLESGSVRNGCG